MQPSPLLAIHGGAGTINPSRMTAELRNAFHQGLRAALLAGHAVLAKGGSALDAVTSAVMALEDDALFNAARGAVLTTEGKPEMDAAIMQGRDRQAGAVAGICGPRNPILAARAVMETTGKVLLIGEGALRIARKAGLAFEPPSYFITERRKIALANALDILNGAKPDTRDDADRHGTVGAVARDATGGLAAATSTGGLTAKLPGRVGDTPVFGAGTYADDVVAVSCTGTGEVFIRYAAAHEIASRIRYCGKTAGTAASEVIAELGAVGGDGGLIALGATGPAALPFNSLGMYRGTIGEDGIPRTAIHREAPTAP
jgi:beta-aspartyl-peptidase (threonine type)